MRRKLNVLVDSSVYGAAIEDEAQYSVDSIQYWDIVYSKALLRSSRRVQIFGCPPVLLELREAPERLRLRLLAVYSRSRPLRWTKALPKIFRAYVEAGISAPDALIASFASVYELDALCTINRRHLSRPETIREISAINKRFHLGSLRILLPGELIQLIA